MTEKKIGKVSVVIGRKAELGIGCDISKYGITFELGLWFIGVEL
jgi:hypothetical protein